jgi:hypothetical protein
MKKYIFRIALMIVASMFATACSSDFMELDKGSDTLTLTPSATQLTLTEANHSADGLTLEWTTGTNYGTGNKINYVLQFSANGNTYNDTIGNGVYKWSKTVGDLNTYLAEKLGIGYGETVNVNAKVIADVAGYTDKTQTSETNIAVTTYQPVTSTLFIMGSATNAGTDASKAISMTRTDAGQFTWIGPLTAGTFKFITTKGSLIPSYNRDANNAAGTGLIYRSSDSEADEGFTVTAAGNYEVKVDLLKMTCTVAKSTASGERFNDVYFVGSFTNWGFVRMTKDVLRKNLWHYGEMFTWNGSGEFKFGTVSGSWDNMLVASSAGAPYTSTVVVYNSSNDNKWALTEAQCGKAYKIMLDVTVGSEKMVMKPFTPYAGLYLVGDATPNGWTLSSATAMTADASNPYLFTWTGALKAGEMKISCDKKSDWMGAWFMADASDKAPTGGVENAVFVDKSDATFKAMYPDVAIGDVDMKWKIATAGTYTITLNQLKETISIVKQ